MIVFPVVALFRRCTAQHNDKYAERTTRRRRAPWRSHSAASLSQTPCESPTHDVRGDPPYTQEIPNHTAGAYATGVSSTGGVSRPR